MCTDRKKPDKELMEILRLECKHAKRCIHCETVNEQQHNAIISWRNAWAKSKVPKEQDANKPPYVLPDDIGYCDGYNQAIQDTLEALNE